jgi:hypothetical protein
MRNAGMTIAIVLALIVIAPGTALATWGTKCSRGNGHHCYAVANWQMSGGEEVQGLDGNIDTTNMDVAEAASGAVVNDEQWAIFEPKGWWVEDGQQAGGDGGGVSCCQLRWFTAYDNASGYTANESPWEQPPNTPNSYTLEDAYAWGGPAGEWCFSINNGSAGCAGGFPVYSNRVETGMEAASEQEPVNSGRVETGVMWTNGAWHHWNRASLEDIQQNGNPSTHVCTSQWQSYAGDINFGTC